MKNFNVKKNIDKKNTHGIILRTRGSAKIERLIQVSVAEQP
jgi:hypothetical protein